jgi:hypothetical protein
MRYWLTRVLGVATLGFLVGTVSVYPQAPQQPSPRPGPGGQQGPGGGRPPGGGNAGGPQRPAPRPTGGRPSNPGNRPPGGQNPRPNPGPPPRPTPRPPQRPGPGNRPGNGSGHRPGNRPPQWGRPPQNRPNYAFRPNDRGWLRNYYRHRLGYINRGRRPIFRIGGYFPLGDIAYLSALPPDAYGYLPPPPPGYQMGYFDGYVVVYDPITYFIANVIDLL